MSSNIDCLWGHVPLSRRNMGHSTVDYNEAGGKAKKLTFSKRGGKKGEAVSFWQSSLSSLKVLEALKSNSGSSSSREHWRGVGDGTSREAWDRWRDELYTVGIHFLIIPLGQSFPLHSLAIKHPPYGTFGKGRHSAPQQAGVRGEPRDLKMCWHLAFWNS